MGEILTVIALTAQLEGYQFFGDTLEIIYENEVRVIRISKNLVLKTKDFTINGGELNYFENENKGVIRGNPILKLTQGGIVKFDSMVFNDRIMEAFLYGNVDYEDSARKIICNFAKIRGDTIWAWSKLTILQLKDSSEISGDSGLYLMKEDIGEIKGNLTFELKGKDSLKIFSKSLRILKDTLKFEENPIVVSKNLSGRAEMISHYQNTTLLLDQVFLTYNSDTFWTDTLILDKESENKRIIILRGKNTKISTKRNGKVLKLKAEMVRIREEKDNIEEIQAFEVYEGRWGD